MLKERPGVFLCPPQTCQAERDRSQHETVQRNGKWAESRTESANGVSKMGSGGMASALFKCAFAWQMRI